jgi:DNA repair exonuclease SbcCD ATPase subunit
MVYKLSFILSLLTSIIFYYLLVYLFDISIKISVSVIGIHFVLLNFSIIIFFNYFKKKLLNYYSKIRVKNLNNKNIDMDFGDDLFKQMFLLYSDKISEQQISTKKLTELKEKNLEKDTKLKNLIIGVKNSSIEVEEDYEELLNVIKKIEKTYDDLSINYQKNKLKEENLLTKVSKLKEKLAEPVEISTTIVNEIESSVITLEKERDVLDKLKSDIKIQQKQFKDIRTNIAYDINNLEQLNLINKNLKSVISKVEDSRELEAVYKELETVLESLKSVDRKEQQKIFQQYEDLNDNISNIIQKIKTIDLILLFMTSVVNNINKLKSMIREIQKEDYDVFETKKIHELDKLGDLLNTYLGTMINFKNDFQSLVKIINKY